MSILNVNTIQPVGSGQTITVSAANISAPSTVVTASSFVGDVTGNVTGNLNSTGVTTVTNLTATNITVGTAGTAITTVSVGSSVGIGSTLPQTKLDVVGGIKGVITQMTSQVSTAGTSINFTGIPSWAKRVTVMFNEVSTSGSNFPIVQLGTSSGVISTGYVSTAMEVITTGANVTNSTAGFIIRSNTVSFLMSGQMVITNVSSNTWVSSHTLKPDTSRILIGAGSVTLSGTLDRVRITTNSADTFDAGSLNVMYEG